MDKISVSAVSYTNTFPFLYGLRKAHVIDQIDLSVDVPSSCAQKVINREVDLGIIPVAALVEMENPYIITDYCIGTEGAVDSVFIFSSKPIHEIQTLSLDPQSRTSNGLAQVLLKFHWKQTVQIVHEQPADAYVLIGDRTFGQKQAAPYVYDLGFYWKQMTGLPFAFAVWVANRKLPDDFIAAFNAGLKIGVDQPEVVIPGLPSYPNFDYKTYLTENLNYHLTVEKRLAIKKYLSLLAQI